MKTKIVYVVASLNDDIYMEQAIVSAWSARHYNPGCRIEMACDQDTFATFNSGIRAQYKSLFDQIHVREFLPEQSMMERSRWLKTTLRQIIEGDFLYLDTDTVVCANLSYIDDLGCDLGLVMDHNCELNQSFVKNWVISIMKVLYNMDVSKEKQHFNGGVAFVRDCQKTREFYHRWNELWAYSMQHFNQMKDQPSLMKTNIDLGYVITELSGNLNCQIASSIQYLYTAHVMHFYNNMLGKSDALSPLFKDVFLQVKQNGFTKEIQETILNCKSSFTSPSMPVPCEGAILWRNHQSSSKIYKARIESTNSYKLIYGLWYYMPKFMRVIDIIIGVPVRLARQIRNLIRKAKHQ